MARVTYVKRAQQRYETVPVIDPETGEQKRTPVMRKDGTQKTTKKGRPVFLSLTKEDRTKPKPNLRCDFPGCSDPEIRPGQSYKHITPRSGPYGGHQKNRHVEHPNWNVWEYSSSLSARIAEIEDMWSSRYADCESEDDVTELLSEIAEEARSLASEKEEAASNIEDGFGHETEQSMELVQQAESLNDWADEIESADAPEFPEPEETDCEDCGGTGTIENKPCQTCDGEGTVTPEEPTEEQIEEWLSEVEGIFPECSV